MMHASSQVAEYQLAAKKYIEGLPAGEGYWLTDQRRAAARRLGELGIPNRRQEAWRYTDVQGLLKQGFVIDDRQAPFSEQEVRRRFLDEPVAGRLVFVDGLFQPGLSDADLRGVEVHSIAQAMAGGDAALLQRLGEVSGAGDHAFAALNMATLRDGALVRVAAGTRLERPIELLNVTTRAGAGRSHRIRHLLTVGEESDVNLVERYLALADSAGYFNNLAVEIVMGKGARMTHQRVQQEGLHAYHLCDLHLSMQSGSHYHGVNAAIGAAWSRTVIHNRFTAPGAECELDGLYLVGDRQLADLHLDVDHAVPGCESREDFKGILFGRGRAVFDGRILVQRQAQKSSAHLSNANLMLSRSAEIDTKPQLEIFADDVQCSHGTTVGQLDDQALFYLRSRGLGEAQARRLLCLGFADEILQRFDSVSLREQLAQVIQRRVEEAGDGSS